jgi:4'-phosphopantetheinyl transferase
MIRGEVHVWSACFDGTDFSRILSADEMARAGRYRFARHRARFIWVRGLLRTILGEQLGRRPAEISFACAPGGKPYLLNTPLCFNVSDSQDRALIAVACEREVGVDIEFLRPDTATSGIAERFFAAGEIAALRALPAEHRVRAFFICWTRKEAYLKARGTGLALPLARFEVTLSPDLPPALVSAPEGPEEVARWKMQDIAAPAGYAAALVAEGHDWELCLHER